MPSTFTGILRTEQQADGENASTWGATVNVITQLLEDSIAGVTVIATTGGTTILTTNNNATDQARSAVLRITGTLTSNAIIEIPNLSKPYLVLNETSGSFTVTMKTNSGAAVTIGSGLTNLWCDGSDVITIASEADGGLVRSLPTGTIQLFQQTAAPTGWTKNTTHDDKALRVVSGTPISGGSVAFSTVFGLTATDGFTLLKANLPSFNLDITSLTATTTDNLPNGTMTSTGVVGLFPGSAGVGGASGNTAVTTAVYATAMGGTIPLGGSDTAHAHAIDLQVQHVDLILATKD